MKKDLPTLLLAIDLILVGVLTFVVVRCLNDVAGILAIGAGVLSLLKKECPA
ncbi:MAG: hypothetical protein JXB85_15995 [Anaerolineales bacterium]|nr:hypothetical protein [Anaerolineales bacterium]